MRLQQQTPKHGDSDNDNREPAHLDVKQISIWRRLGLIQIAVLLLGSVMLIFASLTLGLIWRESILATTGAEPNMY